MHSFPPNRRYSITKLLALSLILGKKQRLTVEMHVIILCIEWIAGNSNVRVRQERVHNILVDLVSQTSVVDIAENEVSLVVNEGTPSSVIREKRVTDFFILMIRKYWIRSPGCIGRSKRH
jgi:hypothetical protein